MGIRHEIANQIRAPRDECWPDGSRYGATSSGWSGAAHIARRNPPWEAIGLDCRIRTPWSWHEGPPSCPHYHERNAGAPPAGSGAHFEGTAAS